MTPPAWTERAAPHIGGMKTLPSRWQGAVIVCGKCSKRIGGGFGPKGKTPLHKALARAMNGGGKLAKLLKWRSGVVESRCLKVCPKSAVVVIDGRAPGTWLIVPKGADVDALADRLSGGSVSDRC